MDESSFDIDPAQLAETSRRFPSRPLLSADTRGSADVSYLSAPEAEFGRHVWDEGGHP